MYLRITQLAVLVLIVFSVIITNIPNSFAFVGYTRTNFVLDDDPTICVMEPTDPKIPSVGKRMLSETQYSVIDWVTKLNEGIKGKKIWNINLQSIPLDKQKEYSYTANCDIMINFKREPSDEQLRYMAVGLTQYNYENKKAVIEIYYLQVETITQEFSDSRYTYAKKIPYYTDHMITNTQLATVIRHEIGHGLGLGHYHTDDKALTEAWATGQVYPPSIMIEEAVLAGVNNMNISPVDIYEMKLKYGDDGFFSDKQISQESLVLPSWIKNNAKWWANDMISDSDFVNSIQYLIKVKIMIIPETKTNSSSSNEIPSWVKDNAGSWAEGKMSESDFVYAIKYLINTGIIKID